MKAKRGLGLASKMGNSTLQSGVPTILPDEVRPKYRCLHRDRSQRGQRLSEVSYLSDRPITAISSEIFSR
jgi:hypothetical protein